MTSANGAVSMKVDSANDIAMPEKKHRQPDTSFLLVPVATRAVPGWNARIALWAAL